MVKDLGNALSGSGAGERATGTDKALAQRAPRTREVRADLENMMIESVVREQTTTAPGLKFER